MTHCTSAVVACRSTCSKGRARVTTEPSRKAMLDPRIAVSSTYRPTCGLGGKLFAVARIMPSSQGAFRRVAISSFLEPWPVLTVLSLSQRPHPVGDGLSDLTRRVLLHEAYLYELARHEEELRQEQRTERLLRQSGLPL